MARHRASRFGITYRHQHLPEPRATPAGPPPLSAETTTEPAPPDPRQVQLVYPDDNTPDVPVDWSCVDADERSRHLLAVVPNEAKLAHGMVIRVDPQTVAVVALSQLPRSIGGLA
jgi:hypothetical protein